MGPVRSWSKSVPGGRHGKCKGPEAGMRRPPGPAERPASWMTERNEDLLGEMGVGQTGGTLRTRWGGGPFPKCDRSHGAVKSWDSSAVKWSDGDDGEVTDC